MKVYVDLVFILNYFFDFLLLFGTSKIIKKRVKLLKLSLGAFIGSISILFLFVKTSTLVLFIFKIIISIFMILISFGKKNFIKNYVYFYIISIFLGGAMYLLNITFSYKNNGLIFFYNGLSINFIIILLITPIIIYSYVKENIKYNNIYSNYYNVELIINKKKYNLLGYLDTGNTLVDPYHKRGVILLNFNQNNIIVNDKKIIFVPYKTITSTGVIKCFKPDKIIINNNEFKDILVGNTNNNFQINDTNCILPNIIKEKLI